jgi:ribosome-associated protein
VAKMKKKSHKKPSAKKKNSLARKPVAKKPAKSAKKIAERKSLSRPAPAAKKRPDGIPEQMRNAALKVLDERQAEEIVTVSLAGRSSVADYLIIASGRASRQIAAIAHYLKEAFEELGACQPRIEGLPEGNWVLVDAGDVIVHLFRPEVRHYYNIEDIWNEQNDITKSAFLIE